MTKKHRLALSMFRPEAIRRFLDRVKPLPTGIYVFLWHDVTDSPSKFMLESQMFSSTDEFKEQIRFIDQHFTIISPEELATSKPDSFGSNERYALISFDDAWLGIFNATQEILRPLGIKPIIFTNYGAVTHQIDFSAYHRFSSHQIAADGENEVYQKFAEQFLDSLSEITSNTIFQEFQGPIMTDSHLRILESSKSAYISNHLYHHFDCGKINHAAFVKAFEENRKVLSSFSNFLDFFAFPYGDPNINTRIETMQYLSDHAIRYFWANQTFNPLDSANQRHTFGRIGVQREKQIELWIKVRRSRPNVEKKRI